MKNLGEYKLAMETELLGENLPQRHFANHKFHMTWAGIEPGSAAMIHLRLTAWATARPIRKIYLRDVRYLRGEYAATCIANENVVSLLAQVSYLYLQ
jgi:hypothetical protein